MGLDADPGRFQLRGGVLQICLAYLHVLEHPEVCDVNRDGACNIGDALRIAQCDVGVTSCAFTCKPFTCP